ncbi:MAG: sulfite exporter TauE/SafE family protein, partial [Armatimonadota bacterium]|nr:sulfite exporter TauE/SafE family protein [Armatimonadota bacterium]
MCSKSTGGRASLRRLVRSFVTVSFMLIGIPVVALAVSGAVQGVPQILGGSKAYAPSFAVPGMLAGGVLFGLVAGLITGVIGAGGGYIITPALMSLGIRGIMAVGTDQFHIFANSLIGTFTHRRQGNVNLGLAAWFAVGSVFGVSGGARVNRLLYQLSPAASDAVISAVYVLVFAILAAYCTADWLGSRRCEDQSGVESEPFTALAERLQHLPLKPRIRFDGHLVPGGRSVSIYPVVLCGAVVGFAAALMGIGGGLLTFPLFVYGLGVSTCTTVGTSVLQILVTTAYSSVFQYGIYGFVFYTLALAMLAGSIFGVHIGTIVTALVPSSRIRFLYALTVLAGFANRACALPQKLADLGYISIDPGTAGVIERIGTWLFFGLVGVFGIWILAVFGAAARRCRKDAAVCTWAADSKKLVVGLGGVLVCFVFLVTASVPKADGSNMLSRVDGFFNRLAKHSADFLEEAAAKAEHFRGTEIDVVVRPEFLRVRNRQVQPDANALSILRANGVQVET